MDYLRYFFTGYQTADMSPSALAFLNVIRQAILLILGFLAQGLANQFSKGDYTLNFATLQGYVMPGVVLVLNMIWAYTQNKANPSVTVLKEAKSL